MISPSIEKTEGVIRTFHDFILFTDDVKVDPHRIVESFSVRVFDSPVGQGELKEQVIPPKLIIHNQYDFSTAIRKLEKRLLSLDEQIAFGEILADLLLPEYARELFQRSLSWAREDGIRLRLRLADEISSWPWEYIYIQDAHGEKTSSGFLCLDPRISIVRHQTLARRPTDWFAPNDSRRVVVAMASPEPYPKLTSLPKEQIEIRGALEKIKGLKTQFIPSYANANIEAVPGARINDLMVALTEKTDIVHFSGHGEFFKELGPSGTSLIGNGAIVLADATNQAVLLPADRFAEMLRSRGVRLVVLGACETGQRDNFQVWSSVAASLMKAGVPAVVAMQFSIRDQLAASFMAAFYRALVAGEFLDNAISAGRAAIRAEALISNEPDIRDWGVPVFYLRSSGERVFTPVTDTDAKMAALEETAHLVNQQLGIIRSGGRVIGAVTQDVRESSIEVHQNIQDVEADAVVIGNYSVQWQGGNLIVEQTADEIRGTMIGMVKDDNQDSSHDNWLGIEQWLQAEFKPKKKNNHDKIPASPNFCPKCGLAVTAGSNFCLSCGEDLRQ